MKTHYLMTYRESGSEARRRNLETVLAALSVEPELEVIVVEQDVAPTLDADLLQGARSVFVYNAGPFNKAWGLNVAARIANAQQLIFADADMLLPAGLSETRALLQRGAAVVKPYRQLVDLTASQTASLDDGQLAAVVAEATQVTGNRLAQGEHLVLCGGVFAINAATFGQLGGWDERFLGWGGEDDALSLKVQRLRPSVYELDQLALHLHHPRDAGRYQHAHYASNVALVEQYRQLPELAFNRLLELQRNLVGNPLKYSPPDLRGV